MQKYVNLTGFYLPLNKPIISPVFHREESISHPWCESNFGSGGVSKSEHFDQAVGTWRTSIVHGIPSNIIVISLYIN